MDVWVVCYDVSRQHAVVLGVASNLDSAKRLAEADWADPDRDEGKPFAEWKSYRDGATWNSRASTLESYVVQRFTVVD